MRRARELDPLDATHHALSAQLAFTARDYPLAVDRARQGCALSPEFWVARYQLAQAYEQLGRHELALEALQTAAPFSNGNSKYWRYAVTSWGNSGTPVRPNKSCTRSTRRHATITYLHMPPPWCTPG